MSFSTSLLIPVDPYGTPLDFDHDSASYACDLRVVDIPPSHSYASFFLVVPDPPTSSPFGGSQLCRDFLYRSLSASYLYFTM